MPLAIMKLINIRKVITKNPIKIADLTFSNNKKKKK